MKIFIALGSLLVLVLSVVLVAPLFIDWTAFRADFEREASRILGQPVRVLGEAEARLLPFPSLTFTRVVVGEADAEPVMTLDRFRMDAELAPYLSGEIRIFQMSLERPHLRIPIGAGESGLVAPSGAGSTVVLEDVSISDGRVSLVDAQTGRSREFTGIDAQISAQTLSGPFAGTGRVGAMGEPMSFSLSSGRIEEGGRWPLRLTLGSQRLGVDFTFDGETMLGDGEPDFAGRFDLASRALEEGEIRLLPPVQLGSRVEIGRREALLSEIRAEVGSRENPYVLTGDGSFDVGDIPHFDLTLRGEQIDVDELAGTGDGEAPTFAQRAIAVRATLTAIPRIDIPGRVDLTLPIVTAGDTTIRNLSFAGSPTDQGWTIRNLRAELPGQTLLEASGVLDVRERFAFAGDVLVAARQPGRFAEWMTGRASPELAQLNRAGFEASVRLSQDEQSMDALEVDVGGQQLTGRLERSNNQDLRSVSADLAGEAVDLDAFLAFARLFTEGSDMLEAVQALDVRFEAGPVTYDGMSSDQLSLDFSYADDLLDLRHAVARGLSGADVDARGFVARLSADPLPELVAEISTHAPERLAELIAGRLPGLALAEIVERASDLRPLALTATVSSPTEVTTPAIELKVEGTAGQTLVDLTAALENGVHAFERGGRYGVEANLSSEDSGALLRQFGAQGLDLGLPSPLSAELRLSGEGSGPVDIDMRASAPGSRLSFDGSLMPGGDARAGNLSLRATSDDASPWLTAAGASFAQGLDALPLDLGGALSFAEGGWTLTDLQGSLAETSLEASLVGGAGSPTRGELHLGQLSLPWLATLTYGVPPDLATSPGLWPQELFAEPLPALGEVSLDVSADRLELGEASGLDAFSARLDGEGGSLRFEDIAAGFDGGRIAGSAAMANAGGFGSLRLDLSLDGARVDTSAMEAGLSGHLQMEGSGRSYAEIAASLTGEGEVRLADAQMGRVPPASLPAVLAAADAEGFEATSEIVSELVSSSSENASFPVGEATVPVAIAVGVARFLPVTVEGEGESLTGSGALDLRTGEVSGSLDLAFRPEEDDRIDETTPAISYRLDAEASNWELASVEGLTSFLSLRAYRREQERLEALREELRESVRLRREARLYRWREAERARIAAQEQAALEAERLRVEAEDAARAQAQAERAAAERAAALEAERQAAEEAARRAAQTPPTPPVLTAPQLPVAPFELPPPSQGFQGLPGVEPPLLPSF